jgi:5-methyltetrahydropteroyltriglutamate--homocysteine methyltransferase
VIGDGEQSRQHFVHGFLEQVEGIDFENKVTMGIRNNRYDAQVPQVIAPTATQRTCPRIRSATCTRPHQKKLKFTLPGPMTIVDTVADRFYGKGKDPVQGRIDMAFAFAELLNQESVGFAEQMASTSSNLTNLLSTSI